MAAVQDVSVTPLLFYLLSLFFPWTTPTSQPLLSYSGLHGPRHDSNYQNATLAVGSQALAIYPIILSLSSCLAIKNGHFTIQVEHVVRKDLM